MKTSLDLAWKQNRFELAGFLVASAVLAVAATYLASSLAAAVPPVACFPLLNGGPITAGDADTCPGLLTFVSLDGAWGERVQILMSGALLAGGALLGSQLVARELEQGTTQLAWALTGARTRWLSLRLTPVAGLLIVVSLILAGASTALEQARHPGIDLLQSFLDYGYWGPLLVARTIAVLAVSVFIGAVVGRTVPSVLLSLALAAGMVLVLPVVGRAFQPTVTAPAIMSPAKAYPLYLETNQLGPDGRLMSYQQALDQAPTGGPPGSADDWVAEHFRTVTTYLPGDRAVAVAIQEGVVDLLLAAVSLGLTAVVLRSRRAV